MFPCEIHEEPARSALSVRFRAPMQELPSHFERAYGILIGYLAELGEAHAGGVYAAYHNMDMQNLDVEAGFTVARPVPGRGEISACTIPAGSYAICHYTGPYNGVSPAYENLMAFISARGYTIMGPPFEWYLNGPEAPPQELKTDIVFLVKQK
ncbi:MAG: GyrI-like domain-containing protein [Anaerolineae bacterium]|nr:GyrI-like domain-containing protein [Anaerolineae bacterium]